MAMAAYGHEHHPPPPGYAAHGHPPPGYGHHPPPEHAHAAYGYGHHGPPPPEYAPPGYGAPPPGYGHPPPGYGPPPPGAPPAAAPPPPAGYDYRAGYYDPGYGYGPPPGPGYPYGYPPPPEYGAYPPPPGAYPPPGVGYPPPPFGYGPPPPHQGHRDRRDGDRRDDRGGDRRTEGGDRDRDRGGGGNRKRRGGKGGGKGGGDRDRDRDHGDHGGYGKADGRGRGRHDDRSGPYANEPIQANNLYVTGLPADIDEQKLRGIFSEHGKVTQCKVLPPRPGEQKTVALIRFDSADHAKKVKEALNGTVLPGLVNPVSVRFAENKNTKDKDDHHHGEGGRGSGVVRVTGHGIDGIVSTFEAVGPLKATRGHEHHKGQLYVAGLPPDTGNVHLYRLFAPFGSIGPKGVHAMMTPEGKCKGIAFVNFLEEEAAQLAIATYNGAVLPDGTAMKVSMKMPKGSS